jgi:DnaA-homolog protein
MMQLTLDMGMEPTPSFQNYLVGPNTAALAHLQLWVQSATRSPVPTYLWGEPGCGKSHLLRAAQSHMAQAGALVGWLDASLHEPPEFNPAWAAVLLDDVHAYNPVQQHAAFKWFIEAQTHQRWVLASGSLPVADLALRDDLRTRLGWGHVFGLQLLSEAERRSVLRQQADARGIFLKDEVMDFILNRFSRDLGSLTQMLDHLDHFALAQKRPITVPLVKNMLAQL